GRGRQLIALVSGLVPGGSARGPAVILIDDLHWIDPASDALLGRFLDGVGGTRTLVLLNFRPEYQGEWVWRPDYHRVALRPLGHEATEELLTALLGTDPTLAALPAPVGERARGHPLS